MPEDRLMERMSGFAVAVLDSGAVISEAVHLEAKPILGLLVPALNGTPAINLEVSLDGGVNYYDLLDSAGSQGIAITGAGAGFVLSSDDLSPMAGYVGKQGVDQDEVLVRLVADATQTAEREFVWLMVA